MEGILDKNHFTRHQDSVNPLQLHLLTLTPRIPFDPWSGKKECWILYLLPNYVYSRTIFSDFPGNVNENWEKDQRKKGINIFFSPNFQHLCSWAIRTVVLKAKSPTPPKKNPSNPSALSGVGGHNFPWGHRVCTVAPLQKKMPVGILHLGFGKLQWSIVMAFPSQYFCRWCNQIWSANFESMALSTLHTGQTILVCAIVHF